MLNGIRMYVIVNLVKLSLLAVQPIKRCSSCLSLWNSLTIYNLGAYILFYTNSLAIV